MKTTSKIILLIVITLFALVACKATDPQVKLAKVQEIDAKLEQSRYTFEATTANPMGGKIVHLTPGYTLKVTPDSIVAYLPYYGRAYSVSDPTEGGIKFVSTDFKYSVSEKSKGSSRVAIEIKDSPHNYKLSLLLGETGRSTLYVNQNNKQGITFVGDIH